MSKNGTVAIRFPREVWRRVRARAFEKHETGLAWLTRCAEYCLEGKAGIAKDGIRAEEPPPKEGRVVPSSVGLVTSVPEQASRRALQTRLQGQINRIQGRPSSVGRPVVRDEFDQTRDEEESWDQSVEEE